MYFDMLVVVENTMSVLDEVLLEEYDRSIKIKKAIENEQVSLPKGSIQQKIIHNVPCFYLVYREGDKVKSQYINKNKVEEYRQLIQKRRDNIAHLKELNASIKKIERALGKDQINEYSAKRIY